MAVLRKFDSATSMLIKSLTLEPMNLSDVYADFSQILEPSALHAFAEFVHEQNNSMQSSGK